MGIPLPDARQLSDEVLEALRFRALHGCELGFPQSDLADLVGVSRETVCRWWSAYTSGGVEALRQERTGRPEGSGRISDEQAHHIQELLDANSPEDLGIASPLWSRRAVGDLIKKELGIELAVRSVGDYLQRWGDTAKKPGRHSKDQDPQEFGSGWKRRIQPSKSGPARRRPTSTGATRPAARPISNPVTAMPKRESRRRWMCLTVTAAVTRSRRSATRGRSAS